MTDNPSAPRPTDVLNVRGLAAKKEYVRGLEQRRDAEALSLLVECLCDESSYLRDLAGQTFRRLGSSATPVLLPLLDQGLWYTRTSVSAILGDLACRDAVPGLLRLTRDANRTVAEGAFDAMVAIARHGGAVRLAWELQRLAPDTRRAVLHGIGARDRALEQRVSQMMGNTALMGVADPAALSDDSPLVRAGGDGMEWDVLTSPAPPRTRPSAGEPDETTG